jgi:hypothetical protein
VKRSYWARRYALSLLWWAAAGWPLAVAHIWTAVAQFAIWGLLGTPIMGVAKDRRWARLTGWDRQHRTDLIRAARRGDPPADPADRSRLRDMVATEVRETRGLLWFAGIWPFVVASLLFLPDHRPSQTVLIVSVVWYVLLAGVHLRFGLRIRARQRQALSVLDSAAAV